METVRILLALLVFGLFMLGGVFTIKGLPQRTINMVGVVGFVLYCITFFL